MEKAAGIAWRRASINRPITIPVSLLSAVKLSMLLSFLELPIGRFYQRAAMYARPIITTLNHHVAYNEVEA